MFALISANFALLSLPFPRPAVTVALTCAWFAGYSVSTAQAFLRSCFRQTLFAHRHGEHGRHSPAASEGLVACQFTGLKTLLSLERH